jgi:NAD(P)-dependent dehydrogenase (short-subunit alcohol dehydrogenase family)
MSERPVAIVTGGSAGIGATICRQMIEAGYEVISVARRKPDWSHPALHAVEVDLTDAKATEQVAADLARRFPISVVVHNAGIIRPNLLLDVRQEDLSDLAQLHLGAAILLVQAALPGMRERHFGRVVLISSRAALGLPTRTVYSATKAGMIGMARTWSLERPARSKTPRCSGRWFPPAASGPPLLPRPYRCAGSGAARTSPARSCSSPIRQARSSPAKCCMFAAARASPVSASRP